MRARRGREGQECGPQGGRKGDVGSMKGHGGLQGDREGHVGAMRGREGHRGDERSTRGQGGFRGHKGEGSALWRPQGGR